MGRGIILMGWCSGGNLGGAEGGGPPPFTENWQKQSFRVQMGGGGGGCLKFESFVWNLGGFAPPPPEKVNFRHWVGGPEVGHWILRGDTKLWILVSQLDITWDQALAILQI
jgi:hypothetical protein